MEVTTNQGGNHHFIPPIIPIDMSSLTHSELHSLSLLSSSTPSNDTVSNSAAKFYINPSQSTHQQTYSLSPHPRRHRFSLLNKERFESNMIVSCLKKRLQFDDTTPDDGPHKRNKENENATVEIVNRNGVVVDLAALEERENDGGPFAEELRKMAEGRVKQEELLEVLGGMEGDWCSRRKKRRVVDASLLGDALPLGWKIIVALRRKGGQFFPYCRRYLSPTGEQLSSCKEVSLYLQSYFGINDAKLVRDNRVESQQLQTVDSVNHMCMISEDGNSMMDLSNSPLHSACLPIEHETDALLLGIENLPDVRICDLYECCSCNVSFDERDKYKQHMFTLHQKTTKRYSVDIHLEDKVIVKDGKTDCQHLDDKVIVKDGKTDCQHLDDKVIVKDGKSDCQKKRRRKLGLSVSDGVIMKDGKYGCQFCPKVFEERRRYLGHVGNHVKGSIETPKDLLVHLNGHARAPCMRSLPSGISNPRVDALVEIAQSSNQPNNGPVFVKEPSSVNNVDQLSAAKKLQHTDQMSKSNSCHDEVTVGKRCRKGKTFTGELYRCKMVSGKLSACPNNTVGENGSEEGKLSSQGLHPSCDRVRKMSVTDADANHLDPSIGGLEGEDIGEDKILSLELNPQGKMREILGTDVDINVPATCPDEREIEKDVRKDETLSMKINPLAKMSKMSIVDGEIKRQSFICNIASSEKNSCSETTMTPAAESGIAEIVSCNNTAADDEDLPNIHPLWCNEKSSDYDSSGKRTQLDVHMTEPKHAQNYDSDLVTISGKNHASNCTAPQVPVNSSSTFDEIFEKAGQDICSLDQNLESVNGLEYLKLDVIEPQMYKYNAMSREDSISFYDVSMDLRNNIGLGLGLDDPLKSQPEFPQEMARSCLTTTVCVWCGVEFSHEIADIEPQPDSVGFMCPSCRAKISKQFNELENNFSLSPQLF
ncbi:uncharacterized protein LOC110718639 isoform X2 [Chenopodium quinoa]|uniref:uncharacterized protein LOC110718639 isoform X2 n=1 Tax=Chenopodium quinoa TaxID=63459 RepID=UPI000B793DC6|nr:uncharacterized protein LOC110718639 isoform X2 [Chenopodium quinoa]